jgi:hypothetical protein
MSLLSVDLIWHGLSFASRLIPRARRKREPVLISDVLESAIAARLLREESCSCEGSEEEAGVGRSGEEAEIYLAGFVGDEGKLGSVGLGAPARRTSHLESYQPGVCAVCSYSMTL